MQFSFDNQQQSIMGVVITDRQCYRCVRDAMLFNVYEGWRPTVTDVQRAVQEAQAPDSPGNRKFMEAFQ